MSARPTRLANVPLGREIGVHRRASWRIHATLIIFGLKNAGRNPAGQEDEWAEKSEVKHSGTVGSYDWSKLPMTKRAYEILARAAISGSAGVPGGDSEA